MLCFRHTQSARIFGCFRHTHCPIFLCFRHTHCPIFCVSVTITARFFCVSVTLNPFFFFFSQASFISPTVRFFSSVRRSSDGRPTAVGRPSDSRPSVRPFFFKFVFVFFNFFLTENGLVMYLAWSLRSLIRPSEESVGLNFSLVSIF